MAGATATARRRAPAALRTAPRMGLPTAAVVEEAGVGGSGSASAVTPEVSDGELAAGRLGLEEATAAAAGARAVGSAAAGGSGHREEAAVVADTEEGRLASGAVYYC